MSDEVEKKEATPEDDVVFEEVADEQNSLDPKEQVKRLKEQIRKLTEEKQEYLVGWQRAKADLLNARKRDEEEKREFARFAKEDMLGELLPVLQSFEMAFGNKEAWEKVDMNWRAGVEYIYNQIRQILEANGLKEVNPLGLPFDPSRDEAVEYVPVEDEKLHHVVTDVLQKGYNLHTKQLRAPRVKVGEFKK